MELFLVNSENLFKLARGTVVTNIIVIAHSSFSHPCRTVSTSLRRHSHWLSLQRKEYIQYNRSHQYNDECQSPNAILKNNLHSILCIKRNRTIPTINHPPLIKGSYGHLIFCPSALASLNKLFLHKQCPQVSNIGGLSSVLCSLLTGQVKIEWK